MLAAHWGAEGQREPSGGQPGIPAVEGPAAGPAGAGRRGRDEAGHPLVGSDARGEQQGGGIDSQMIPPRARKPSRSVLVPGARACRSTAAGSGPGGK